MSDVCSPLKIGCQIYPQELEGINSLKGLVIDNQGLRQGLINQPLAQPLIVNNQPLEAVNTFKLLGVNLTYRFFIKPIERTIEISLVFLTFNFMLFALDHWVTLSSSCCNFGRSSSHTLTTSEIAQSSTYLYKGNSLNRSLTIIRKNRGPSLVPCGTPAFISFQSDLQVFNLTRCCLP